MSPAVVEDFNEQYWDHVYDRVFESRVDGEQNDENEGEAKGFLAC